MAANNRFGVAIPVCRLCKRRHMGKCGPEVELIVPDLSYRENQIVRWICLGYSAENIAAELELSPVSMKSVLSRICAKCGVSGRMQLALKFLTPVISARVAELERSLEKERNNNARMKAALDRERAITNALLNKASSKEK